MQETEQLLVPKSMPIIGALIDIATDVLQGDWVQPAF
jgi:hypothetical protein